MIEEITPCVPGFNKTDIAVWTVIVMLLTWLGTIIAFTEKEK